MNSAATKGLSDKPVTDCYNNSHRLYTWVIIVMLVAESFKCHVASSLPNLSSSSHSRMSGSSSREEYLRLQVSQEELMRAS